MKTSPEMSKPLFSAFEAAVLGLKVNFVKSELIGIRAEESVLCKYADILGCRVGDLPVSYLGLPLCLGSVNKYVGPSSREGWEKVVCLES